jgi:hypothetical protein
MKRITMSNMSYCRFQNTLFDLEDCVDYMDDDDLSPEEAQARECLVEVCAEIVEDWKASHGG